MTRGQARRGSGLCRNLSAHLRRPRQSRAAPGRGVPAAANAAPARCPTAPPGTRSPTKCSTISISSARKIHSAWALTTSEGIIVIDTLFDYAIEPEIVDGLTSWARSARRQIRADQPRAWRPRPRRGAAAEPLRRQGGDGRGRLGFHGAASRHRRGRGAQARHRRGTGRPEITLGDTTIDVIATPGHTPGTLSYIFPVKDRGAR